MCNTMVYSLIYALVYFFYVLHTIGSHMLKSNPNNGSGSAPGMASRGSRYSKYLYWHLNFEVANTIVKGATLKYKQGVS